MIKAILQATLMLKTTTQIKSDGLVTVTQFGTEPAEATITHVLLYDMKAKR